MTRIHAVFLFVVVSGLNGCVSYQSAEHWRRGSCDSLIEQDEKARCLEQATQSENEYKQDVREATGGD